VGGLILWGQHVTGNPGKNCYALGWSQFNEQVIGPLGTITLLDRLSQKSYRKMVEELYWRFMGVRSSRRVLIVFEWKPLPNRAGIHSGKLIARPSTI